MEAVCEKGIKVVGQCMDNATVLNTVFVVRYVHPNFASQNFTNTENVICHATGHIKYGEVT